MIPELTIPIKIEIPGIGSIESADLYLKSEVDRAIDFWKKESHDHYERWFSLNKQYEGWFGKVMRCERAERELRHQKYKRCLAMAKWCGATALFYGKAIPKVLNMDITDHRRQKVFRRLRHYEKWNKRWLQIAEQFKEGK